MSIQFANPLLPHAAASGSSGSSSGSSSTNTAVDYQKVFMQLLATELRSQDPTQPINPTEMVTQMVQINQLSDVAGIYSLLQQQLGTTSATGNAKQNNSTATPATTAQR